MKLTKWILTGVVAAGSCHNLMAGNFGAEYTTEWQTDFRQGVNWVNLLHLSYSSPTFLGMQLNAASVSIAQTREEAFMHDLQTFSNIEEENLPFALSMLGIGRETEKYSVFFGIRNVNEDISPRLAPPCSQTVRAASFQHCQPKRRLPTIRLLPSGSTERYDGTGGSFNSPSTTARATNS